MSLFASLDEIQKTMKSEPPRIVIYGVQGIGKSSWGAIGTPNPIIIQTENGYKQINVNKWPVCKTLAMVENYIDVLIDDKHDYRTLVLDTLDGLEALIFDEVVRNYEKPVKSIASIGWSEGYELAVSHWNKILAKLDELQEKKKMMIICVAHPKIKKFNPPNIEPYDRYELNLHEKGASRVYHWADAVLFLNYKTFTKKIEVKKGEEITQGIGEGERTIYTEERPAYLAKNRYDFPTEISFPKNEGWAELKKHFKPIPTAVSVEKVKKSKPAKTEEKPATEASKSEESNVPSAA